MGANLLPFWDGWTFCRTELSAAPETEDCFQPVEIPHDWLIYDAKNLYRDGCGWYRKEFRLRGIKGPVILRFEGVYMDSTVYVNGQKVMDWKYGYSTFDADITEAAREGMNEVIVQVRFQAPNSRWYSGAGIYRRVWIRLCGKSWLPLDGTYVSVRPWGGAEESGEKLFADAQPSGCPDPVTAESERVVLEAMTSESISLEAKASERVALKAKASERVALKAKASERVALEAKTSENTAIEATKSDNHDAETKMLENSAMKVMPTGNSAPEATGSFLLEAQTETAGDTEDCFLRYSLWRDADKVRELAEIRCGELLRARVDSPLLWDVDDPQCYELRVELCQHSGSGEGTVLDWDRITIGFRTISFDSEKGCFLNGRPLKIHGVCEHHDLGCLGAAFHAGAMERKLKLLKAMGVNAVRTSHNMQAPEFMELADKMGFLVVDEAFDMWERTKTTYDYGRFFKEWWERDVRSWVRRDRNHPCVMLWSIGNEIYDTHADEHGQEITRRLMSCVREHDPKENAPVTIGSNYMAWENARKCADIVKFAGYNYGEKYFEEQHREHPDWIMYGSETASLVQSRGIYHFPLSQPVLADEDEQCSALGNSTTSWGARSLEKCIMGDRDAEYIFGQFLWSGFDYIGEPTPYHTRNSYFGQIDTAGFPKDAYYVFQAEWTDHRKAPMVHLFPYWDFNPGQLIDVRACTNAPAVELLVNGISQGRQEIDHERGEKLLGDWQVPYEPGTITAIAYDEAGNEIARESRCSFGDSFGIRLTVDRETLSIEDNELCFLTIETTDAQGNPVENAADYVRVDLSGPGRLLGMDNGDSTDCDEYKTNVRKLFSGKLLAVIGSTGEPGEIRITVTGEGLQPAEILLQARYAPQSGEADSGCRGDGVRRECLDEGSMINVVSGEKDISETVLGEKDMPKAVSREKDMSEAVSGEPGMSEAAPGEAGMLEAVSGEAGMLETVSGETGMSEAISGEKDMAENVSGENGSRDNEQFRTHQGYPGPDAAERDERLKRHPVRKVEIYAPEGQRITKEKRELAVEAVVYPAAAEPKLIWKAVNAGGIEIGYAAVRETEEKSDEVGLRNGKPEKAGLRDGKPEEAGLRDEKAVGSGSAGRAETKENLGQNASAGGRQKAVVTAYGDGEFYVRCIAEEGEKKVLISQLEFRAEGLGHAFLDPYELISAGLYTDSLGEIGNGNEKGIATARDGVSGVVYSGIDFGGFGSDEITLPVFALSDEEYPIEIWLGKPFEPESRLIETVIYRKPSKWNTYQEETWKLPERIRGVATLGFVMRAKVHLKGFRFTRLEKAFERLWAADADSVYGDSFRKDGRAIRNIGNNVTLVYENMDFGENGTESVTICGCTPLERNSIHIHFTDQSGETVNRILEFSGNDGKETDQTFSIEKLTGCGRVEIIFLPGSCFDLVSVLFWRKVQ